MSSAPGTRFSPDPWRLVEAVDLAGSGASTSAGGVAATLFAVSNGYLGVRGDGDGARGLGHGTFVNGFHETFPIRHAEDAHGLARCGQVLQGVPDVAGFAIRCNGVRLGDGGASLVEASRELDFRDGVSCVQELWRLPKGGLVRVRRRRMVSLVRAELGVFSCEVTAIETPCEVEIARELVDAVDEIDLQRGGWDPRKAERVADGGLLPGEVWQGDAREVRVYRCRTSREPVAVGWVSLALASGEQSPTPCDGTAALHLAAGQSLELTTVAAYHTVGASPVGVSGEGLVTAAGRMPVVDLADACRATLDEATQQGPDALRVAQRRWLDDFWERGDVRVEAGEDTPVTQQAIRWSLFQLAQASAQVQGHGIPAKGLTGSGYSGHYFWDTEIYVLPFLTYTRPASARALLEFRHAMLPAARRRARDLDLQGALFPWRTINGEEASAYYPAGTAQFHIDADIAFASCQYAAITGDRDFLATVGVDLLVETARMWLSLGFWQIDGDGRFHLHGVTGPDEYTAVVDDNLYTNVMARFNLAQAADLLAGLAVTDPARYAEAVDRLGIVEEEPALWRRAADDMLVPWDAERGIHPQDAHFLDHQRWDVPATPPDRRPLLLHYHPLVIYRHQVLKQADVVLALLLRGVEFTAASRRADFEYYEPLTTGDSTLSGVSQAIIAAEVGHVGLALERFREAVFLDLHDRHHNTSDGVHLAAAGGIWSLLVCGFGGLRDFGEAPRLDPRLPAEWQSVEFCLTLHGTTIRVRVAQDAVTLDVLAGDPTTLTLFGQEVEVSRGHSQRVAIPEPGLAYAGHS